LHTANLDLQQVSFSWLENLFIFNFHLHAINAVLFASQFFANGIEAQQQQK
jgi:hypothetical protein